MEKGYRPLWAPFIPFGNLKHLFVSLMMFDPFWFHDLLRVFDPWLQGLKW